jgi:hypothetical protein
VVPGGGDLTIEQFVIEGGTWDRLPEAERSCGVLRPAAINNKCRRCAHLKLESFLTVKKDLLAAQKNNQKTVNFCKINLTVKKDLLDAFKLVSFFEDRSRLQSTKLGGVFL